MPNLAHSLMHHQLMHYCSNFFEANLLLTAYCSNFSRRYCYCYLSNTSLKSKLANFWVLFKKLYSWKAHFLAMSSKVGALTIALQIFYINTMNKNISWVSESLAPVNGAQKIRSLDFRKVWFLQYISLDKQCNIIQLSIQNYTAYNLMIVIFWL